MKGRLWGKEVTGGRGRPSSCSRPGLKISPTPRDLSIEQEDGELTQRVGVAGAQPGLGSSHTCPLPSSQSPANYGAKCREKGKRKPGGDVGDRKAPRESSSSFLPLLPAPRPSAQSAHPHSHHLCESLPLRSVHGQVCPAAGSTSAKALRTRRRPAHEQSGHPASRGRQASVASSPGGSTLLGLHRCSGSEIR